jgi:hypothetical protein
MVSLLKRPLPPAGYELILDGISKFVRELERTYGFKVRKEYPNDVMLNTGIALMYCIYHGDRSRAEFSLSLGKFVEAQSLLSRSIFGVDYDSLPCFTLNTWAASTLLRGSRDFGYQGQVDYLQRTKAMWDRLIGEKWGRGPGVFDLLCAMPLFDSPHARVLGDAQFSSYLLGSSKRPLEVFRGNRLSRAYWGSEGFRHTRTYGIYPGVE